METKRLKQVAQRKYLTTEKGKVAQRRAIDKYQKKNKEQILEQKKGYYLKNKDKWNTKEYKDKQKARDTIKGTCETCGSIMLKKSLRRHIKSKHTII